MIIRLLLLILQCSVALAATDQNPVELVKSHAHGLAKGQQGEIAIEVGTFDIQKLAPCSQLETYTPTGARSIGRSHVGLRCISGNTRQILVPVKISVIAPYVVTARPINAGDMISASDITLRQGDLASLPSGVLLEPGQVVGKISRISMTPGHTVRSDHVRAPFVILQGQAVKVVFKGTGFAVSAEGKATMNAGAGELAKIRMLGGRLITGVVEEDGSISVSN